MAVSFENRAPGLRVNPALLYRVTFTSDVSCPASPFDVDGTLACGSAGQAHRRVLDALDRRRGDGTGLFGAPVEKAFASNEGEASLLGLFGGSFVETIIVGRPDHAWEPRSLVEVVNFHSRGKVDTLLLEQIEADEVGGLAGIFVDAQQTVVEPAAEVAVAAAEAVVETVRSLPSLRTILLVGAAGVGAVVTIRLVT